MRSSIQCIISASWIIILTVGYTILTMQQPKYTGTITHTTNAEQEQLNSSFFTEFQKLLDSLKILYSIDGKSTSITKKLEEPIDLRKPVAQQKLTDETALVDKLYASVKKLLDDRADVNFVPQGRERNALEETLNILSPLEDRRRGLLFLLLSNGATTNTLAVKLNGDIVSTSAIGKTLIGQMLQDFYFKPLAIRAVLFGTAEVLREILRSLPSPTSWVGSAQTLWNPSLAINGTDIFGLTALHWAVIRGDTEKVKLLLHYKADLNLLTPDGMTAAQLAIKYGHPHIAQIIAAHVQSMHHDRPSASKLASFMGHYQHN